MNVKITDILIPIKDYNNSIIADEITNDEIKNDESTNETKSDESISETTSGETISDESTNKTITSDEIKSDESKDDESTDENDPCPICHGELEDIIVIRDCKHKFCRTCITEWFNEHHSCPICRDVYNIEPETNEIDTDDSYIPIDSFEMLRDIMYSLTLDENHATTHPLLQFLLN